MEQYFTKDMHFILNIYFVPTAFSIILRCFTFCKVHPLDDYCLAECIGARELRSTVSLPEVFLLNCGITAIDLSHVLSQTLMEKCMIKPLKCRMVCDAFCTSVGI